MDRSSALWTVLILLLACTVASAQAQEVSLPEYSPEQRWGRAGTLLDALLVFGIRHGQMLGQDVDEVADAMVQVFGPGWGADMTPPQMLRAIHRNWMMYQDVEFEVLESSEEGFRVRTNRPYADFFGEDGEVSGVTMEDYETLMRAFHEQIAAERGMVYEQQVEANAVLITVRKH